MERTLRLLGPFRQVLPLSRVPLRGAWRDEQLELIQEGGLLMKGERLEAVGPFDKLYRTYRSDQLEVVRLDEPLVALPGLIDAHTHLCFAGSRARDFAARNNGKSYLEIAAAGGGIWSTVQHTRKASQAQLEALLLPRLETLLASGITTVEVKSGYGLRVDEECKMLRAIQSVGQAQPCDVLATCLAAHMVPRDFDGTESMYLDHLLEALVPLVRKESLAQRFDIFIEKSAFSPAAATAYLRALKERGFDLCVHGDQFTVGGSAVAIACGARSVDHLEVSGEKEIEALAQSTVVPVALPGASIGLGCAFTPARRLLDRGASLAIASDWNPGSAPQGQLLAQAAILSCYEKLSAAEVWAGLTCRAAAALGRNDRGRLSEGLLADIVAFPTADYREILYHQGSMQAARVWKRGREVNFSS
ncbi:MAG: imidazolonepropionase [Bacteroidota bacterium]